MLTIALLTAAAGCMLLPQDTPGHNPAAIRDAYLIAHGMARSYSERPDADPAVLSELRRLDRRAATEVGALVERGDGSPDDTARAVAALTDYAAQQTPVSP
ncbi:MAG: hypothetical protein WDN04_25065 [Rhodospirillales bacterium]